MLCHSRSLRGIHGGAHNRQFFIARYYFKHTSLKGRHGNHLLKILVQQVDPDKRALAPVMKNFPGPSK